MHATEVLGTLFVILFTAFTIVFSKFLWVDATVPFWAALTFTVIFGAISIWACTKIGRWLYYTLKKHFSKEKK